MDTISVSAPFTIEECVLMRLPIMANQANKTKEYTIEFRGLNYSDSTSDGEFTDMQNLSSRAYPALTQRQQRSAVVTLAKPNALYARGELCYVDGTSFYYYDDATSSFLLKGTVIDGPKQFAVVNTKIVIWPDRVMYDTETGELLNMQVADTRDMAFAKSEANSTIVTTGTAFSFKKGDAVKLSGCTSVTANNDITAIIREISEDKKTLTFDPVFTAGSETAGTLTREVPDMDFICASNNRLWGCGGGQIYASALGQPENFNVFDGLSTDSYAVAVGSDGDFTGCTSYGSMQILFHKEHVVHKIVGTKPSNYELSEGHFHGIMAGSNKSAVLIDETLYYWSRQGLQAYTGSIPYNMSQAFGERRFKNAIAASDGQSYYVSMQDDIFGKWGLYVFDIAKRLWTREDDTHAVDITMFDGKVYYLDSNDGKVYVNGGSGEDIEWSATLCPFGDIMTETKHYSRFSLRAELEAGSYMEIEVSTDGGPWKRIKTLSTVGKRVFSVPIMPTRCDSLQLRLSGNGGSKTLALTRQYATGSEKL